MSNINEVTRIYPKATKLIEGWNKRISIVENKTKTPLSFEKKLVLAQTLENTKRAINIAEATQASDIGQYKRFALDVTTAAMVNLIAYDIVSVQPISNRIGMINYLKYTYGSTKGSITAGDEYSSALKFSGSSNPNYSSSYIEDEGVGTVSSGSTHTLAWAPVIRGSLVITDGTDYYGDVVGTGTSADIKKLVSGAPTGTKIGEIVYSTQVITFSGSLTSAVAGYQYNNETVPVQVPEINISIDTLPVTTKSRKLKAVYGMDAAFELYKEYGSDIDSMLIDNISSELGFETDSEIMLDLYNNAGANNGTAIEWSATLTPGISQREHFESFNIALTRGSNIIYGDTRRARANFMIGGLDVITIVSSMPSFKSSGITNPVGPYFVGTTVNGINVYANPFYSARKFVLGYKGNSILDAGYFYCPYMPIATTQMVQLADFSTQRGWATTYGTKLTNANLYLKGSVTGSF